MSPDYYRPDEGALSRIFPKAIAERLIGDDGRKVPKSFVPDKRLAFLMSRVANHYRRLAAKLITLHEIETRPRDEKGDATGEGTILSFEEAVETYPSIRSWKEFHDWVVEHLGSLEGFSTKAAVRAETLRENELRPQQPALPENSRQGPEKGGGF